MSALLQGRELVEVVQEGAVRVRGQQRRNGSQGQQDSLRAQERAEGELLAMGGQWQHRHLESKPQERARGPGASTAALSAAQRAQRV